jgi:hypothetical protein
MAARGAVRYPAGADRKLLKSAHARTIKVGRHGHLGTE